jgi:hypothetical protein
MKLRLLPEAERDLEIGADFYESQKIGLGTYFNDCLSNSKQCHTDDGACDIYFFADAYGLHSARRLRRRWRPSGCPRPR